MTEQQKKVVLRISGEKRKERFLLTGSVYPQLPFKPTHFSNRQARDAVRSVLKQRAAELVPLD